MTNPQLSVLMPSQHAFVSGSSHRPAGHDISFHVRWSVGPSFILAHWEIVLLVFIYQSPNELRWP